MSVAPDDPGYPEPVIIYTVRQLLGDLRKDMTEQIEKLSAKLDDRVTVAVFRAMRADLDAALLRLDTLEDERERGKGVWLIVAKASGVVGALVTAYFSGRGHF